MGRNFTVLPYVAQSDLNLGHFETRWTPLVPNHVPQAVPEPFIRLIVLIHHKLSRYHRGVLVPWGLCLICRVGRFTSSSLHMNTRTQGFKLRT